MKKICVFLFASLFLANQSMGLDLKDIGRAFDKSYKCKKNDQGCKNREHLLAAAKIAAVAVAVKYIADMIIEQRAKKVSDEERVITDYKNNHDALPDKPQAATYTTSTLPGSVVQPGKKVVIQSDIVVVPGREQKETLIQERLAIFDNEDNTKELKSLTKDVNDDTKRGGRYTNEFTFTLPEGLPQGVYPIKTTLILNGEEKETINNNLQLVLQVNSAGNMLIALR
ncbi:hypothetical protein [Cellvibrio sp.]|uniref:hypothetical protein n=1 Tax=Cellvibrio sp. TaxID=1965322 RepID=UPI0039648317